MLTTVSKTCFGPLHAHDANQELAQCEEDLEPERGRVEDGVSPLLRIATRPGGDLYRIGVRPVIVRQCVRQQRRGRHRDQVGTGRASQPDEAVLVHVLGARPRGLLLWAVMWTSLPYAPVWKQRPYGSVWE